MPRKPTESAARPHWTVGAWGGQRRFACAYCPFDCLDEPGFGEAAMRQHYDARHAPPAPAPVIVQSRIVDRYGNPVVLERAPEPPAAD